jgi:hypothetical protein
MQYIVVQEDGSGQGSSPPSRCERLDGRGAPDSGSVDSDQQGLLTNR